MPHAFTQEDFLIKILQTLFISFTLLLNVHKNGLCCVSCISLFLHLDTIDDG